MLGLGGAKAGEMLGRLVARLPPAGLLHCRNCTTDRLQSAREERQMSSAMKVNSNGS